MTAVTLGALVLGAAGAGLGAVTARVLGTGGYRIDEDKPRGRPGQGWWPPVLLAVLWAWTTQIIGGLGGWAALPAYLLFGWLSVALVWIDVDVHRLPNGLVLPAYPAIGILLIIASAATSWTRGWHALVGGAALYAFFWILAILPGGGMGGGDVKLAGIVGALLAWLSPWHWAVGVMATFLVGGLVAVVLLLGRRVGLKSRIAFGPAMCAGVFIAIGWTPEALRGLVG